MATRTDTRETRQQNKTTRQSEGREPQRTGGGGDREREVQVARGGDDMRTEQGRAEQGREAGTAVARRGQPQRGLNAPGAYAGGSPFAMMRRMMDDMDRLFSDFGVGRELGLAPLASFDRLLAPQLQSMQRSLPQGIWSPQVEVFERGDRLVVRADLPGLTKDDVELEIENDALVIRGERKNESEDERDGYYHSERSYGSFYRAIPLPDGADADDIQASFQNGVLEVTLPKPKQEQRRGRKIEIRS